MFTLFKQFAHQLISPKAAGRAKYETFKELLKNDRRCHELLAEIEDLYYQNKKVDINVITGLCEELSTAVSAIVACLSRIAPGKYINLRDYYKKFDFYIRFALAPPEIDTLPPFLLPLKGRYQNDLQVGGKAFHLAQLKTELCLPVPDGFIISSSASNYLIDFNNLRPQINKHLRQLDISSSASLHSASATLTSLIFNATIPAAVEEALTTSWQTLQEQSGSSHFAIRSSAVNEDSDISFAGQYDSALGIDSDSIFLAYKRVLAGKFSTRALFYRISHGLLDEETAMAVLVLPMIDAVTSGVITTSDPTADNEKSVIIHSVRGLGENLVGGLVSPNTSIIKEGKNGISVEHHSAGINTQEGQTTKDPLPYKQVAQLAAWCRQIESFYHCPQEIEWSINQHNQILLLQTRSLFVQQERQILPAPNTDQFPVLLSGGETASRGAASGRIFHITSEQELDTVPEGVLLVTPVTPPSLVTIINRLTGVIAKQGSVADHFASVAREFGVPVLVKIGKEADSLQNGREVTLWAEKKQIFDGRVDSLLQDTSPPNTSYDKSYFRRSFKMVIDFISPLKLTDPSAPSFVCENCRSFHDIIRFAHEKGVQAMFSQAESGLLRKGEAKTFQSKLPLNLYIIDLSNGTKTESQKKNVLQPNDICSVPLIALLQGLTNRNVKWSDHDHFDWKTFDDVALAGGVANKNDSAFSSYALISKDYLNLNMRFGYHFALLDSLCGTPAEANYIMLRFAGGGGDFTGKSLRLDFIETILSRLGFTISQKGDLLDARLMRYDEKTTAHKLDMIGRLLGATKLMDMILDNETMVAKMVEEFMAGRYDFSG